MTQPPPPPYGAPDPQQPGAQQPGPGAYPTPSGQFFVGYMGQEHGPLAIGQLAQMAVSGQLRGDSPVRLAESPQYFMAKQVPGLFSDKDWLTTVLLSWLIGSLGIDRFYLGYTGLGILKLLTLGGCGIWQLIDAILVTMRKMPDAQGRPLA